MEEDAVKAVLDFDAKTFEVFPPKAKERKYVMRAESFKLNSHKWRFCVMWTGS